MEVSGQLYAPAALPPGTEPPGTHWIWGWVNPQIWSGRCEEEKNLLPLPEIEPVA
jgi:hypothetical protein